jgi:hypothetical protein
MYAGMDNGFCYNFSMCNADSAHPYTIIGQGFVTVLGCPMTVHAGTANAGHAESIHPHIPVIKINNPVNRLTLQMSMTWLDSCSGVLLGSRNLKQCGESAGDIGTFTAVYRLCWETVRPKPPEYAEALKEYSRFLETPIVSL